MAKILFLPVYFLLHIFIGLTLALIVCVLSFVFYGKYAAEMEISDWLEEWVDPFRKM